MAADNILKEGEDFTVNEKGQVVFTSAYHLKRGWCCQSGCINCPYGYHKKVDPNVPPEYQDRWECVDFDDDTDFDPNLND
jgi:hypothetical protein